MKAPTRLRRGLTACVLFVCARPAAANEPPVVQHQPLPCTVPGQPLTLCANVTDDGQVAKVRLYFRRGGAKFYSFVEMSFGGLDFCGTLPAPREGKVKSVEYYVQAVDDVFESQRTSTFQMAVMPEAACEFPPVEKNLAKAAAITIYATHKKQGNKFPDEFERTGVSFIPMAR